MIFQTVATSPPGELDNAMVIIPALNKELSLSLLLRNLTEVAARRIE